MEFHVSTLSATAIQPLDRLSPERFDIAPVLKRLGTASRQLAELKGVAASIPNQAILINSIGMQEAKDSSAIENIVTTHDELFRDSLLPADAGSPAAKEVLRYRQALRLGFDHVRDKGMLTNNLVLRIQREIERSNAGFRKVPGTALKNQDGRIVYTPPSPETIIPAMADLEQFINRDELFAADPLIKMALIHHQFESIHPFYDGNGRTGRIINVLYLVQQRLLDIPVLYMSRHIVRTKSDYYRLLQDVRERDAWEEWVLYMLTAVEETAREGIATVISIRKALLETKHRIRRELRRIYSQDLINTLFSHPYTKIQYVEEELGISRITATRYLDALTKAGFLTKQKIGRTNFFINRSLYAILTGDAMQSTGSTAA